MSKLMRGTFIMTLGTYISKFLGLFYVIPFAALVGEFGLALYHYGYVPYTIFISVATAGIPAAVSKFISKHNAMGEYAVGRKLFKSSLLIMLGTGIAAFLTLYALAPVLADIIVVDDDQISDTRDVVAVIRAVSFALIIVPLMSLVRGFFQGHQSMGPSAVSQVVEQIVRIAFLLIGVFVVMKLLKGEVVDAVQVATFAAFIGALGGLGILTWFWFKRRPYLNEMLEQDKGEYKLSFRDIYKEIFISAIPFIMAGVAIPVFQLVDMFTHNKVMAAIGLAEIADTNLGILNVSAHKIVIIPVSLSAAFSISLVPMITDAFVQRNRGELVSQINQTFQVLLYLTLPAAIGISLLAEPIYTMFYGANEYGSEILQAYAPIAILFAFFSVTTAILQGINEQKFTVFSLLLGLLIKLLLNVPFIEMFETKGAIYATTVGFLVAITINLFVIRHYAEYRFKIVFRRSILIVILNAVMAGFVYFIYFLCTDVLPLSTVTRGQSIIIVSVSALLGAGVYFYISSRIGLLRVLFPTVMKRLKSRLQG